MALLALAAAPAAGRALRAALLNRLRRSLTPEQVRLPCALPPAQGILQPCRIATVGGLSSAGWHSPLAGPARRSCCLAARLGRQRRAIAAADCPRCTPPAMACWPGMPAAMACHSDDDSYKRAAALCRRHRSCAGLAGQARLGARRAALADWPFSRRRRQPVDGAPSGRRCGWRGQLVGVCPPW